MYRGRGGRGRGSGGGRGRARGRGRGNSFNGPPRVGRSPPRRRRSPDDHSRDTPYCTFCKIQLSSKKAFSEHKEGAVHKQKEILIKKAISDGLHYCYTCERIFPNKVELDAHCLMTRHQPLYRVEGIEAQFEKEEEPEKTMSDREKRRAEDDKDRHKIVMQLNELKEGEKEDDRRSERNRRNYCKICSVDCINESNYKAHLESWRHRAEVDKKKEQEMRKQVEQDMEKKYNEIDGQNENGEESVENDNRGGKMQVPSNLTTYSRFWCELCSVGMTDNDLYLQHVRGRKHMRTVSQMKRPYKCYVCHMTFTVEQDFNHHLESKAHIDKAFKKNIPKGTMSEKDSGRHIGATRHRDDSRDRKRLSDADRKVEIIKSPMTETGDLRDKLQGKTNIVITKTNNNAGRNDEKQKNQYGPKLPQGDGDTKKDDQNAVDRRAKEMEFEAKFRKLVREYGNNQRGLKERLTKDREKDIATYQQYESTYSKLCREEDYVRDNIRVLDEGDPRKEEYIRDMIRIQNDMREVRQELEIREMMIIKRESLFRERFQDVDNKVVIKPQSEPEKSGYSQEEHKNPSTETKNEEENEPNDLRVQLERERLLKKLGPELNSLDPVLRDKLLSVIIDEKKDPNKEDTSKTANKVDSGEKKRQMALLTEREKELQKELAALKSNTQPSTKKKITKSLVPQYDDVEDKKDAKKKTSRRSRSKSSDSSESSSSSSDNDDNRKDRRRRRRSRSPSSRRYNNTKSSDRSRKKRRRSSSHERDRKKKSSKRSHDSRSGRREDKKKVKLTIKGKEGSKVTGAANPLVIDESSNTDGEGKSEKKQKEQQHQQQQLSLQQIQQMPSSSNVIPIITGGTSVAPTMHFQQRPFFADPIQMTQPAQQAPPQRREQFSFWKNPSIAVSQTEAAPQKDSPKEDVWDIAFTGGAKPLQQEETDDPLSRLFNTDPDIPKVLPDQILNILRTVAPAIQKNLNQQPSMYQRQQPAPENQFPVPIPREKNQPLSSFPSMGKPEYFDLNKPVIPSAAAFTPLSTSSTTLATSITAETSGGRIRSILKKMKDPAAVSLPTTTIPSITIKKPTIGATSTMSLLASSAADTAIPGLDAPAVEKKPTPEINQTVASQSSQRYPREDYDGRKPAVSYQQPYKDDRPVDRPPTSYAQPETYVDRYDRYGPPQTTTAPPARPYDDPYGRPPAERCSSPPRDRPPPARYDAPPPSREYDERRPPPVSYERDVENFRRMEKTGRADGRLPPPSIGRGDPYTRDSLPPPVRERESLLPPREREPPRYDEHLAPPTRRPGETEDEYYLRFERYYEEKRRREADMAHRGYPPPPPVRGYEDDIRRYPPTPENRNRRPDDRYDDRYYQRPLVDDLTRDRQPSDRYREPIGRDPRDLRPGMERPPPDRRIYGGDESRYPPPVARRPDDLRRSFPPDNGRRLENDRRRGPADVRRPYEGEGIRPDDRHPGEPLHDRRVPPDGRRPPTEQEARRPPPGQDGRRPPSEQEARRLPPQDARNSPVAGKKPGVEGKIEENKTGNAARPASGMINRGIPLNTDNKAPLPRGPGDGERRHSGGQPQGRYDRFRPY